MKTGFNYRAAICVALLSAAGVACSSDSNSNRQYQTAGSRWALSMTDSTFTLEQFESLSASSADLTVNGSVSTNSDNLFSVLTVTSATGSGAPAADAQAFALEMPGSATFIVPFGEAQPLVATVVSSCPSDDFVANWIISKPRLDDNEYSPGSLASDGSGTATYTASSDSLLIQSYGIVDGAAVTEGEGGPTTLPNIGMPSCSEGKLGFSEGETNIDMYFTPTNQLVVKFPESAGNQIISGFPQTAAAVTSASLDGSYSALIYRGGNAVNLSEASVEPAKLTWGSDAGSIRLITNVEANTEASEDLYSLGGFSVASDGDVAMPNGQFRLSLGGDAGQMTCLTSDATPRVIACYGWYNTGEGAEADRRPITILGRKRS